MAKTYDEAKQAINQLLDAMRVLADSPEDIRVDAWRALVYATENTQMAAGGSKFARFGERVRNKLITLGYDAEQFPAAPTDDIAAIMASIMPNSSGLA